MSWKDKNDGLFRNVITRKKISEVDVLPNIFQLKRIKLYIYFIYIILYIMGVRVKQSTLLSDYVGPGKLAFSPK